MKKKLRFLPIILFAVFMLGYSLWNVLTPAQEYSALENRPLAQMPKPTIKTLVSNEFSDRFETYISDQFLHRNGWISAKSALETGLGKLENNDILYGKDDYMFDKTLAIKEDQFQRNLEYLQQFTALEEVQDAQVLFSLVPTASNVLKDKLPEGVPLADENHYLQKAYDFMDTNAPDVRLLPLHATLSAHKSEYIYYRTDHHWTTLGAHYAYRHLISQLGGTPVPLADNIAHQVPDFYGTYYNKAKKIGTLPDTITWYNLPVDGVEIDGTPYDGMYNLEQFKEREKYAAFLYSNHGVTVLRNDTPVNKVGERIVLFKDSYGNSFAPFLTSHFNEVVVVDARYITGVSTILEEYPADYYYVMYSFKNFTEDDNIVKLSGLLS